jgi:hypothetical protein
MMSAGVAERPLDGCDLSIGDWTGSSGSDFRHVLLAQAVAAELQAMRVVNHAVEDGVGEGRTPTRTEFFAVSGPPPDGCAKSGFAC